MFLWIILAILTAAVAAVLFATLARGGTSAAADERAGELAVYRDQLAELERDRESGLIRPEEADYAQAEIGRRLLAAAGRDQAAGKDGAPVRTTSSAGMAGHRLAAVT